MKEKPQPKPDEIEVHPDAWERFEKAVETVMRSPSKHRTAKTKSEPSAGAFRPDSLPLSGLISEQWLSSPKQPVRIRSAERSGSVLVLCSGRLIE